MHFVMYASSNHVKVLQDVTPIDLLVQSAVLSDGVVFLRTYYLGQALALSDLHTHVRVLHNVTPFVAAATNGSSISQQL